MHTFREPFFEWATSCHILPVAAFSRGQRKNARGRDQSKVVYPVAPSFHPRSSALRAQPVGAPTRPMALNHFFPISDSIPGYPRVTRTQRRSASHCDLRSKSLCLAGQRKICLYSSLTRSLVLRCAVGLPSLEILHFPSCTSLGNFRIKLSGKMHFAFAIAQTPNRFSFAGLIERDRTRSNEIEWLSSALSPIEGSKSLAFIRGASEQRSLRFEDSSVVRG